MKFSVFPTCLVAIFLVAVSIRLFNIYDAAQFRGDQGRDSIIVLEHWQNRTIPLTGPRTSTGIFPGPFFFYLIAPPLVLSGFDPLPPTIAITILEALTIVPLGILIRRLWGVEASLAASLLYALSPWAIAASRVFWNPTTVPFFSALLFLVLYFYWLRRSFISLFFMGVLTGILVQLHASAYAYIPVTGAFLALTYFKKETSSKPLRFVSSVAIVTAGFITVLSPYLYHELINGFENIKKLASIETSAYAVTGPLPSHYFSFVLVLPFIAAGYILSVLKKKGGNGAFLLVFAALTVVSVVKLSDSLSQTRDIQKTTWAVETMKHNARGEPFAFVQIAGASSSDLHFRFLALRDHLPLVPYESEAYQTLFLVCDSDTCRSADELSRGRVQAMCFEKYCDREYPYIEMTDWNFVAHYREDGITVYQFSRT